MFCGERKVSLTLVVTICKHGIKSARSEHDQSKTARSLTCPWLAKEKTKRSQCVTFLHPFTSIVPDGFSFKTSLIFTSSFSTDALRILPLHSSAEGTLARWNSECWSVEKNSRQPWKEEVLADTECRRTLSSKRSCFAARSSYLLTELGGGWVSDPEEMEGREGVEGLSWGNLNVLPPRASVIDGPGCMVAKNLKADIVPGPDKLPTRNTRESGGSYLWMGLLSPRGSAVFRVMRRPAWYVELLLERFADLLHIDSWPRLFVTPGLGSRHTRAK